jgi:hypothetical protein
MKTNYNDIISILKMFLFIILPHKIHTDSLHEIFSYYQTNSCICHNCHRMF